MHVLFFAFFIEVTGYKENILSLKYLINIGNRVSLYLLLLVFPSRFSDILIGFSCPFIDVLHVNIVLNVQVMASLP